MGSPDVRGAIEIIKDQFYFLSSKTPLRDTDDAHFFCTDTSLTYEPFFSDFGPLNVGQTYRFCKMLMAKFENRKYKDKKIYYYCGAKPQFKANSACLVAAYMIIYKGYNSAQAYRPLKAYEPYIPFRDASQGVCSYRLTVENVCQAFDVALRHRWLDYENFNVDEYEYFECVENGDLNVIVPNQYVAFCGPHATRSGPDGYPTFTPEDYLAIWKKYNVSTVIRLNKKMYDKHEFTKHGFNHYDMYFIDGTTPSQQIIDEFIEVSEKPDSGIMAVHCKAGLGRTGTCMGCVMMKHYDITAAEAIAWIRLCRPGSIIGPQQNYLVAQEPIMRTAGIKYREEKGITLPEPRPSAQEQITNVEEKKQDEKKITADVTSPSKTACPSTPTKSSPVTRSAATPSTPNTVALGNGAPESDARSPANRKEKKSASRIGESSTNSDSKNKARIPLFEYDASSVGIKEGSSPGRTSARTKLVY